MSSSMDFSSSTRLSLLAGSTALPLFPAAISTGTARRPALPAGTDDVPHRHVVHPAPATPTAVAAAAAAAAAAATAAANSERARAGAVVSPLEGISLEGMRVFIRAHGGRAAFEGLTTRDVKERIVKQRMHGWGGAYAEELRRAAGGGSGCVSALLVARCNVFISHVYSGRFLDVVDAVEAWEAQHCGGGGGGGGGGGVNFYYFDLLVIDQRKNGTIPFETLHDTFRSAVLSVGRVLLLLDDMASAMTRMWCVFELATACELERQFEVIMPPREEAIFLRALEHDVNTLCRRTMSVDVERAQANEPEDECSIRAVIECGIGYLRANQLVIGGMQRWMLARARAALCALPPDERSASNMLLSVAQLLQIQGQLREAEALYRESCAARQRRLGDEHASTLCSLNCLARLLRAQGRLSDAEQLQCAALAARRRKLGDTHPDTLSSISSMAALRRAQGRLGESEQLHHEALAARRCALGDQHPDTLSSMSSLASLLRARGELGEAEQLCREALAAYRRTLRDEHPSTLSSINCMAALLRAQGRLGEAEQLCREALAVYRRTLGDEHPSTLISINNLASLLLEQGCLGEAEALIHEALAAHRRWPGGTNLDKQVSTSNMARLLRAQGRLGEAEPLCREALDAYRRTLGDEHPSTLRCINSTARLLRDLGKHDEAESLNREAQLAARRQKLGEAQHRTLQPGDERRLHRAD